MGNVLRMLRRDVLRLFKAPAALIVAGALLVLPSLYTWYNVVAFWNPYDATGNLKVCVVNQDAGTETSLTGELNVGSRMVEQLATIDKLDFQFGEFDEAVADLKAGKVYAVYVIPEDFSECLVSPLTGTLKKPTIEYYANEKLGPVSPKITDTAASTLEETVNSTIVATVGDAAVQAIDEAINKAEGDVSEARSVASERADAALKALTRAQADLADARGAAGDAKAKTADAIAAMDDVSTVIRDVRTVTGDIADEAAQAEAKLLEAAKEGADALPDAMRKAARVEAEADALAADLSSLAGSARDRMGSASERLDSAAAALEGLAAKLNNISDALPDGWSAGVSVSSGRSSSGSSKLAAGGADALAGELEGGANIGVDVDAPNAMLPAKKRLLQSAKDLSAKAEKLRALSEKVKELDGNLESLSGTASNAGADLKAATERAEDALRQHADGLFGSTLQSVVSLLARVDVACKRLSSGLSGLDTTVDRTKSALGQLSRILDDGARSLLQTENLIGGIRDDLGSLVSDARMLADSRALVDLLGGSLSPENISAFLGSPTKITKEELYHPNAYGTAMAPLFMNLTFWIGAFMLVIIFRLEVDDEGVKGVTLGQRYLSRFLLFCGFAAAQSLICCAGVLFLGVQVASVAALLLGSVAASLAYLSIIYALSASLQHLGKALCIILVFAQIPGGSGLYPLELTDGFFQAVYPFLPFSYGIGALREAIFGFYGNYFAQNLAVLALMFFGMLAAGAVLVPLVSNTTRMAARQVREGGLYNGEEAIAPARPLRISQVVRVLSDRDDYRRDLERRYARFSKMYPVLMRASIALGVGVPVALMLLLTLDAGEKVVLLTAFLLWLLGLLGFLLVVESMRYSFERQMKAGRMSDESLIRALFKRGRMRPARETEDAAEDAREVRESEDANGTRETDDASETEEARDE